MSNLVLTKSTGCNALLPLYARSATRMFDRQHDPAQPAAFLNVPVDLSRHASSGILSICQLDDSLELARYVHFASHFRSDGEAMCLALAESRGWSVATDDRKAIRVAKQAGLTVLSCPELLRAWAKPTKPDRATFVQLLTDIQMLAQFRPNPSMPESAWWYKLLS
jgi:hypothetical protein